MYRTWSYMFHSDMNRILQCCNSLSPPVLILIVPLQKKLLAHLNANGRPQVTLPSPRNYWSISASSTFSALDLRRVVGINSFDRRAIIWSPAPSHILTACCIPPALGVSKPGCGSTRSRTPTRRAVALNISHIRVHTVVRVVFRLFSRHTYGLLRQGAVQLKVHAVLLVVWIHVEFDAQYVRSDVSSHRPRCGSTREGDDDDPLARDKHKTRRVSQPGG